MEGSGLVRVRSLCFWMAMKSQRFFTLPRADSFFTILALGMVSCFVLQEAACQDESYFKPHFDPTATPKPPPPPPVFSFAKFEDSFREMCSEMEIEGRRARFVRIAEEQADTEKVCISCRSWWRSIVAACGKLGPKPTPKPKKVKTKSAEEIPTDLVEGSDKEGDMLNAAEAPSPSPSPTKAVQERYPSTLLLDAASRFSTEMYESDKDNGAILISLSNMIKIVRETKDLTPAEREYFEIVFSYLTAAWDGRIDPAQAPPPTPPADIDEFFGD